MKTHTRNDTPQPTSPRIPIPANRPLTNLSPFIERRIRRLLTWHAGCAGLITDHAADTLARYFFAREMTLADLRKLASHEVYCAVVRRIDEAIVRKNEVTE